MEDEATLHKCARAVVELAKDGHRVALVHGGGSALTRTLKLLGKQSDFIDGLRITDAETRDVALMVLAGMVNKKVVAAIVSDSWVKFAQSNRAGLRRSGARVGFPCSRRWRSAPTASTTT